MTPVYKIYQECVYTQKEMIEDLKHQKFL